MKWYDWYFLSFILLTIALGTIGATIVREYSVFAAFFTWILSVAMGIGARMDWIDFRKRHNL